MNRILHEPSSHWGPHFRTPPDLQPLWLRSFNCQVRVAKDMADLIQRFRQPDPFGEGGKVMKTVLRSDSWGMDDGYPFLIELW